MPLDIPCVELGPERWRVLAVPVPHVPAVREDRVLHADDVEDAVALTGPVDRVAQDAVGLLLLLPLGRRVLGRDGRVVLEVEVPLLVALSHRVIDDGGGIDGHGPRALAPLVPVLQRLRARRQRRVDLLHRVVVDEAEVEAVEVVERALQGRHHVCVCI